MNSSKLIVIMLVSGRYAPCSTSQSIDLTASLAYNTVIGHRPSLACHPSDVGHFTGDPSAMPFANL